MRHGVWVGWGRHLGALPDVFLFRWPWKLVAGIWGTIVGASRRWMDADTRALLHHAIVALARTGQPLSIPELALATQLPVDQAQHIVDKLLKQEIFLALDGNGDIHWAYPGTLAPTAHRVTLSNGDALYGA